MRGDALRSVREKLGLEFKFTLIKGVEYTVNIRITSRIDYVFWHITLFMNGPFRFVSCIQKAQDVLLFRFEIELYVFRQFESPLLFHCPLGLLHSN